MTVSQSDATDQPMNVERWVSASENAGLVILDTTGVPLRDRPIGLFPEEARTLADCLIEAAHYTWCAKCGTSARWETADGPETAHWAVWQESAASKKLRELGVVI